MLDDERLMQIATTMEIEQQEMADLIDQITTKLPRAEVLALAAVLDGREDVIDEFQRKAYEIAPELFIDTILEKRMKKLIS